MRKGRCPLARLDRARPCRHARDKAGGAPRSWVSLTRVPHVAAAARRPDRGGCARQASSPGTGGPDYLEVLVALMFAMAWHGPAPPGGRFGAAWCTPGETRCSKQQRYLLGVGSARPSRWRPPRAIATRSATTPACGAGGLPLAALLASAGPRRHRAPGGRPAGPHPRGGRGVGHCGADRHGPRRVRDRQRQRSATTTWCGSLGADEVLDYPATDFATAVSDVDVVLDTVGGDYPARSLPRCRRAALVRLLRSPRNARRGRRARRPRRGHAGRGRPRRADRDRRSGTEGKLRPVIAATFPLADAAKAHELGETEAGRREDGSRPCRENEGAVHIPLSRTVAWSRAQTRRAQRTWRSDQVDVSFAAIWEAIARDPGP